MIHNSMDVSVYNQEGREVGKVTLPERVFGVMWNPDLVHRVVEAIRENLRRGTANAKMRGEVSGGGKKPWRQKGTGRARHGSTRSPLWRHGGVTHGPRKEKVYAQKINKRERQAALRSVLSRKLKDNEILFIDEFRLDAPKTAAAKKILSSLERIPGFDRLVRKAKNAAHLAQVSRRDAVLKSFRNFRNLSVGEVRNLNAYDVLRSRYLIVERPEEAFKFLARE